MLKLQCINCGHIKKYFDNDIIQNEKCELCGGNMVLPKTEIKNIVNQDLITDMERQIKEMGHKRVWEITERFNNVKTRLAYRKIFLEAGGIIPKTEV